MTVLALGDGKELLLELTSLCLNDNVSASANNLGFTGLEVVAEVSDMYVREKAIERERECVCVCVRACV